MACSFFCVEEQDLVNQVLELLKRSKSRLSFFVGLPLLGFSLVAALVSGLASSWYRLCASGAGPRRWPSSSIWTTRMALP